MQPEPSPALPTFGNVRLFSGAMHYFRIPREYWADRLEKLRLLGLDTIETYVAWNLHEPRPGQFRFDDILDLPAYATLAGDMGFHVVVRPGPYICSEWEFGGLPWWLLKDAGMRLRCAYAPYLEAVDRFFDALLPPLVPLLETNGGPVIAMQVENEYGSYGNDKQYLQHLADGMRRRGIDVPLFTSDGPCDEMIQYGSLPGTLETVNFGSRAKSAFEKLRQYQPDGHAMCMEFWNGWFDHWGENHHTREPADAAAALDEILGEGASVNLYMAHGGTNFGFMSGANCSGGNYQPTIGSYDYDACLDEPGDLTPKYHAFRDVLAKYTDVPDEPLPGPSPKAAYGTVRLDQAVGLFDALDTVSTPVQSACPLPMEILDQGYGFVLYRTRVSGPRGQARLTIRELHDRAHVFVDGKLLAIAERWQPDEKVLLTVPPEGVTIDILVENLGRTNYGPDMCDRKGITEGVLLGQQYLFDWTIRTLPLDNLDRLAFEAGVPSGMPAFFCGEFSVEQPMDTFLAVPDGTHGLCWLNGFNLGRYWKRGPQQTLYVPAPLLKQGVNVVLVFETDNLQTPVVEFRDTPDLG